MGVRTIGALVICGLIVLVIMWGVIGVSGSPMAASQNLVLDKFMGRWFVIASIPTPFERGAYNATEDYVWRGNGQVATTFTRNQDAADGAVRVSNSTGFVSSEDDAVWGMQFVWPFKADYRVVYVDDAHTVTIVGRQRRDFVWLMARRPGMDTATFEHFSAEIAALGYDIEALQRIPHTILATEDVLPLSQVDVDR